MGTADIVTKEYMRENTVFADAFNYLIYNGKKVIDPAKLIEIDSTEIVLPFGNEEKVGEDKKWEGVCDDLHFYDEIEKYEREVLVKRA